MNWLRRTRQAFWGMVFAALWRRTRESGETPPPAFSLLIRGGTVYDGSGGLPLLLQFGYEVLYSPYNLKILPNLLLDQQV